MPVMTKEQLLELTNLIGAIIKVNIARPGDDYAMGNYLEAYQKAEDALCKDLT